MFINALGVRGSWDKHPFGFGGEHALLSRMPHSLGVTLLWKANLKNKNKTNYIGNFDNNYIIFRNVEIFKTWDFQITKVHPGKYLIFKNILFVEMKISNLLINN
jgi:hypothetical protein